MNEKLLNIIDSFQKSVLYIFLLIIPMVFLPLPWDMTEKPMGLVFLVFFSIILFLELIRLFNRGVLYYTKSPIDGALIIFVLIAFISSFFSVSFKTSLWGFEDRMGSGSVILVSIFLFFYLARSFIKSKEDILNTLSFLVFGITLGTIISLLLYWKLPALLTIPIYSDLLTLGLTIYSSARISFVVALVGFLIALYLISYFFANKRYLPAIFILISSIILLSAILSYLLSLGTLFAIIFIIVIVGLIILNSLLKNNGYKIIFVYGLISIVLSTIVLLFLSIPQLRSSISFLDEYLIKQVVIPADMSWRITTSIFGDGILRALIGNGYDTFIIGYNKYRELTSQPQLLLVSSFTYATNHVLNTLANLGILGFLSWIYIGITLGKEIYQLIKQKVFFSSFSSIFLILISIIYILSFYVHFTFIIFLLFFFLNMIYILFKSQDEKKKVDAFVLSLSFFIHKPENKEKETYNTALIIIGTIMLVIINLVILRNTVALLNAFYAESKYVQFSKVDEKNTMEKEKILRDSMLSYETAAKMSNIDTYSRRFSMIITDYVGVLVTRYSEERDDLEKEKLVDDISVYSEIAIEYSRRATEYNSVVYSNWLNRSNIYAKLVGYGLTIHTRSAISAIKEALLLNPLNYELYYSAGQLYLINNDDVSARSALLKVLNINPNHVPSIVLSAEIAMKEKKYEEASQLFEQALGIVKSIDPEGGLGIKEYLEKKLNDIEPLVNIRKDNDKKDDTKEETKEEDKKVDTSISNQ